MAANYGGEILVAEICGFVIQSPSRLMAMKDERMGMICRFKLAEELLIHPAELSSSSLEVESFYYATNILSLLCKVNLILGGGGGGGGEKLDGDMEGRF